MAINWSVDRSSELDIATAAEAAGETGAGTAVAAALAVLNLGDLADVVITTPMDGEVIKYDTDHWENGTDAT